jgi:hypothetical protein
LKQYNQTEAKKMNERIVYSLTERGRKIKDTKPEDGFLFILRDLGKASTAREIVNDIGIKNIKNGIEVVERMMDRLIKQGKVKARPIM